MEIFRLKNRTCPGKTGNMVFLLITVLLTWHVHNRKYSEHFNVMFENKDTLVVWWINTITKKQILTANFILHQSSCSVS